LWGEASVRTAVPATAFAWYGNRMATAEDSTCKTLRYRAFSGAGGGNRTRDSCLEGKGITTMQRPRHSASSLRGRPANPYASRGLHDRCSEALTRVGATSG
jgi:hypothetical protein